MFKAVAICCLLAIVAADVSELVNEYLPPVQDVSHGGGFSGGASHGGGIGGGVSHGGSFGGGVSHGGSFGGEPSREYLAPVGGDAPAHSFSSDEGYRYKTAKRRVFKNRRVFRQRRRY